MTWLDAPQRGTCDLDLLGFGDPDGENMLAVFREIMATDGDDGIVFDVAALKVERIREHLAYGGLRLVTTADIGGARLKIPTDIGFGDAMRGPSIPSFATVRLSYGHLPLGAAGYYLPHRLEQCFHCHRLHYHIVSTAREAGLTDID